MAIDVRPIEARLALTTNGLGKLAINPYQGCAFACEFCSAIKMQYYTGRTDSKWDKRGWGRWVDYKTNLLDLLRAERRKIRGAKIHFGNATDLYQPVERRLRLVPPILEFFLEHPPLELEIQTRAGERDVARDIPLLVELSRRTSVLVSYSIHTDSEAVRRAFEPKAPSLDARERGLRAYFEAGVRTRLSCMPLLPLDPERYAERFAPYVTNHVWVAPTYHQQLTAEIFLRRYPEWTKAAYLETVMERLREAFGRRGVDCHFRSSRADREAERLRIRALRNAERAAERERLPGSQMRFDF